MVYLVSVGTIQSVKFLINQESLAYKASETLKQRSRTVGIFWRRTGEVLYCWP